MSPDSTIFNMIKLLLATNNQGKVREYKSLLHNLYLPELDKTMAELPLEMKNQVSHRGWAAREVYQVLERLKG